MKNGEKITLLNKEYTIGDDCEHYCTLCEEGLGEIGDRYLVNITVDKWISG